MPPSKPKIRLFVNATYANDQSLVLTSKQSHYLLNVMRCHEGERIAVFNGRDGLWLAVLSAVGKKAAGLTLIKQLEPQKNSPDLWLAFAPIKGKTELVVEKAVELGVSQLMPVFTRRAVVRSVNMEKLQAHATEAAEQCGRHDIATISEYKDINALLAAWPKTRTLLYADESGQGTELKTLLPSLPSGKYGVLIGPEGGFAPEEREALQQTPFVTPFCLGPRILRADTAAVAALACVQAWLGDWPEKPHFE